MTLKISGKSTELLKKAVKAWPITGFVLTAMVFMAHLLLNTSAPLNAPQTLETLIPEGFQLIPIEVSNIESLDPVFGQFGFVDLYAASAHSPTPSARVSQAVKLVRAPLNPRQFAVLVRSDLARTIVQHGPTYFVVVQNHKNPGIVLEKSLSKQSSRIIMEGTHSHESDF